MKNIIFGVLLAFLMSGCVSTPELIELKPIKIEEIVEVPNKNQNEIYDQARQWFTNYFVSGESVIDYEDKESGTIIGKGLSDSGSFNFVSLSRFKYKIKVDTKDNKARITVNLINYEVKIGDSPYEKTDVLITAENEKIAKVKMEKTLSDLKEHLLSSEDLSDW